MANEIEKKLWDAANNLRANSSLSSDQYSGPVLGLIFLRHADYIFNKKKVEIEKKKTNSKKELTALAIFDKGCRQSCSNSNNMSLSFSSAIS